MKYYIIYEDVTVNPEYRSARFVCIVEHKEVADDFCKKHSWYYYEEVIIGEEYS